MGTPKKESGRKKFGMYPTHWSVVWDRIPTYNGQVGWILGTISSLEEWYYSGTAAQGVRAHPWGRGIEG